MKISEVFLSTTSELRQIVDLGSKIFSTRVQIQYLRSMSNLGISVLKDGKLSSFTTHSIYHYKNIYFTFKVSFTVTIIDSILCYKILKFYIK